MQREFISVRLCIGLMVLGLATLQARAQDPIEISGGCWNSNQCSMPEPVTGMTRVFGGPGWCVVGTSAGVLRWWFSTSYYPAGGSMQGVDYSRGVGVGGSHLVAARPDGSFSGIAFDYYGNYYGQLNAPSDLGSIRRITAGGEHTVLVQTDGLIRCFGRNNEGQCNAPTGSDFVDVRSKAYHSAAWRADGSVVCWGRNWYGQCNVPADLPPVQHVSVGSFGTVALLEDGSLRAWGSVPSLPLKLPPLEEIDISDSHGVGRTATGEVICWGSDGSGECGGVGHGYTRRKPASLGSVVSIAAIAGVTATVDAAGSYVAWGNDSGGMCSLPQTVHPIRDAAVWGSAAMWLRKDGTMVVRPDSATTGCGCRPRD